jgi:hypothetical protein
MGAVDQREDIELVRLVSDTGNLNVNQIIALQAIEQRLVDLRNVIDQYRRPIQHYTDHRYFAKFYFSWEELEGMCKFIDLEIDSYEDWSLLNSFRTAFREGQFGLSNSEVFNTNQQEG